MRFKYFFQNILIFASIIYSLSGMPTPTTKSGMPTAGMPAEKSLANRITEYKNQPSIPNQIQYLENILSESYDKTIPQEAKIEFQKACIDIWTQGWGLKNTPNFSILPPIYTRISNFFTSITNSYNNFIINPSFKSWLTRKASDLKNWLIQKRKEKRQATFRKRAR